METHCVFSEVGTELFKYYLDELFVGPNFKPSRFCCYIFGDCRVELLHSNLVKLK